MISIIVSQNGNIIYIHESAKKNPMQEITIHKTSLKSNSQKLNYLFSFLPDLSVNFFLDTF